MATITRQQNRLEAAQAELAAATADLDALRARHLADEDVTAEEFSAAGARAELAGIAIQGAQEAEDRARAKERKAALSAIRKELEATADTDTALELFQDAELAITRLVKAFGPARNRRLNSYLTQIRSLGVEPTLPTEFPADDDAGLGWQPASMTHGSPVIRIRERAIGPLVLSSVITAIIARACIAAGEPPAVADATNANAALIRDPKSWLERRNVV